VAVVEGVVTVIYDEGNVSGDAPIGGKAKALLAAQRAGLPVPSWIAVSPEAHGRNVNGEIEAAARRLAGNGLVAVRSSASDEDGAEHSFAGQLESFLNVRPEEVAGKVEDVWRSGFSERVMAYRREQGLDGEPRVPAVIVQRMVAAEVAGVAFSADPVSGRRGVCVVSAVKGLGDALVSGEVDGETWRVDREGTIVEGQSKLISAEQVKDVASLARRAERHFGRPQDVEWAIGGGNLWLLQSRPITSIASMADPDGVYQLWDNSNIAESYGGVTTPMTFSFARHAYEGVYREFCRILSVPAEVIAANDGIFPRMLGLVRGRVYYNLLNWYRLIAMLPGYRSNRSFMEQMMGVREKLPDEIAEQIAGAGKLTTREKWRDRLRLTGSVWGLIKNQFSLPGQIARFYRRLHEALRLEHPLEEMRLDELADHYRGLERRLLSRWDAPLVNDFFAMIFYGVLRKLTAKWCGDADGTLQNDLLAGGGGMISAEPARRVKEMARVAGIDGGFVAALCDGPPELIEQRMPADFRRLYEGYLAKFGDRCLEELKLESPTLHDDPMTLLRSVGLFARGGMHEKVGVSDALREKAEARVDGEVKGFARRRVFRWVLENARGRVRDRENLRFERTRVFGRVRRVVVEMGKRLHALGLLDEPRDVFYLELEEVLSYVEGTATSIELKQLSGVRKAEFEKYRGMPAPDERFVTRGAVYQGNRFVREAAAAVAEVGGETIKGIGCCPGLVRAKVRVVREPRGAKLERGEILVAERTDPGWIMLFPSAAGLLVERGSLLSHSAIVSREMGIPSIVSIPGVMRWLNDGDEVEMDGSTGVVRKIGGSA
jgi:rifampicin phosphotransferase